MILGTIKLFIKKSRYEKKYQIMPIEIYQDLEKINFCGILVNAPKERTSFLKMVYGSDWMIPNMNFKRFEMKNIRDEDQ